MTGMEQDILKPEPTPKAGTQAFSPLGCLVAASGATLMITCMVGAAMVATVWAMSKLMGLPEMVMYALMVLGAIPVLWVAAWTAGRAWHVEQLLAQHKNIDVPVFSIGYYFKKR
jgi:hypothetical protein